MENLPSLHAALAYFALAMGLISVWVKPSAWVWGPFLVFAFVLGYLAKIVSPIALAPVGALLVFHTFLKGEVRGLARFVLVTLVVLISLGLSRHLFPGFHNLLILNKVKITPDAVPFTLYLNFDKPFMGFFVLALGFPLVRSLRDFGRLLKVALPLTLLGVILIILLALFSGIIRFEPKLPHIFWFFALENLLFVSVVEEAFWRGFFQKELFRWFGEKGALANTGCVVITALCFATLHSFFLPNFAYICLVFVAGIVYGSIYQYTRALEASILAHWVLNLTHFALFSYPILNSAL